MSKRHNILPARTNFFISSAKKIARGGGGSLKLNFLSFLIADDSHVQIVWVHVGVFCDHDILHFCPFV